LSLFFQLGHYCRGKKKKEKKKKRKKKEKEKEEVSQLVIEQNQISLLSRKKKKGNNIQGVCYRASRKGTFDRAEACHCHH
ncbi:hypothetical protein V1477_009962, partial [Vespula maculifrons]